MPSEGDSDAQDAPPDALAGLLTLKAIAETIGTTYSRLRGFADAPGVKDAVGAMDVPGQKGHRYPAEALEVFQALIAAQDAGEVEPKTAAGWLRRYLAAAPGDGYEAGALVPIEPEPLALLSDQSTTALISGMAAVTQSVTDLTAALRQSAPVEQFFGLAAAAEATGLSQRTIRANVPYVLDGRRRKYAASDLKAFQASLRRNTPGEEKTQ